MSKAQKAYMVVDTSNGKVMGVFGSQDEAQHRCDNTPAAAAVFEVSAKRVFG